jgi:hypothetical protein
VAEVRFRVRDLGAITLALPSHLINNRPIYDRYCDPLWAAAQDLDVTVSFHGNHAVHAEQLAKRYLDNLLLEYHSSEWRPADPVRSRSSVTRAGEPRQGPRRARWAKFGCAIRMPHPSPAARATRSSPAPTATAPMARATR